MADARLVKQLVPPGIVEQAEGLLIWHGGLVVTPGMTFVNVVVEHPAGHPWFDRDWMRNNRFGDLISASIVDQESAREIVDLRRGQTSGASPIMGSRYAERTLDPGEYVLKIQVALPGDTFSRDYRFVS